MQQYLELVKKVFETGSIKNDRTNVGTISLFGEQLKFDLRQGFPATTVKKLAFKQVVGELICFINGEYNIDDFHKRGVTIWDANINANYWNPLTKGDAGRIYGVNWRGWKSIDNNNNIKITDQLKDLIENIKTNPNSRRHLIITYNPGELDQVCLPACHYAFQCNVTDGFLDLVFVMRSLDLFLGAPFDIASYAILQTLIAKECNLIPRMLTMQIGNAHIYSNHFIAVHTMLQRKPSQLPILKIKDGIDMFSINEKDIWLEQYYPQDAIKAPMAV